MVIFFRLQADFELCRQLIDPPETGVVSGVFVFSARVTQADKQFDHDGRL
jgi:hypothetical protein